MRFQKPLKDRERLYSGVHPKIKEAVKDIALRFDCSMSFVCNTILGEELNIKLEER
jgi:hypothetical protein